MVEFTPWRVRAHMIVLVFVVSMLWGLHYALTWESAGIPYALTFLSAFVVTQCCIADSKVVRKPILLSFQWLMLLFWTVSAPAYLVWTRRLRGVGLAIGFFVLYEVFLNLTFFVVRYLVDGPAFFRR
ncbi:hypothetical protein SAMN05444166_5520 [Singulisphaera sp. GP187]|uniref:hypothetical protein n=1 Tax=Singulisphaera sp. GP187 TaxID=1882752 RepID=UPI00092AEE40|nr:hypothetical protein [Singulisphaera sp. GP187]SIO57906.1 hypothetical protein SAMN05444166_5520 [Singulisphaera sp. GP187]